MGKQREFLLSSLGDGHSRVFALGISRHPHAHMLFFAPLRLVFVCPLQSSTFYFATGIFTFSVGKGWMFWIALNECSRWPPNSPTSSSFGDYTLCMVWYCTRFYQLFRYDVMRCAYNVYICLRLVRSYAAFPSAFIQV
jgi:hypothetical protein